MEFKETIGLKLHVAYPTHFNEENIPAPLITSITPSNEQRMASVQFELKNIIYGFLQDNEQMHICICGLNDKLESSDTRHSTMNNVYNYLQRIAQQFNYPNNRLFIAIKSPSQIKQEGAKYDLIIASRICAELERQTNIYTKDKRKYTL